MPQSSLVEPTFLTHPDYHGTLGPEVAELCEVAGYPPDPEQALLLDLIFAFDKQGESVADEGVVIAPRQNLKTGLFKQAAIGKVFLLERPLFVWSAHEFSTTQEAFRDLQTLIESCPELDRQIKHIHQGSGSEAIELLGGQRIKFKARTKSGGRGLTGDDVLLDEGFALQPAHMGALQPTMAARPDSQMLIGSSAGKAESGVLRGFRDRGRKGAARLIYAEWTVKRGCESPQCGHAPGTPGCVLDDIEALRDANPALDRRITRRKLMSFRASMPPEEFGREFGGWWDAPVDDGAETGVDVYTWDALADTRAAFRNVEALAVDTAPDLAWSSIGAAGTTARNDAMVELITRERGTFWVVTETIRLAKVHGVNTVAIDGKGQAKEFIEPLQTAGLNVAVASVDDVQAACGNLAKAVDGRVVVHGPQPDLDTAVRGSRRRYMEAGQFVFSRRTSTADISPLYAITLAAWAAGIEAPKSAYADHPLMVV